MDVREREEEVEVDVGVEPGDAGSAAARARNVAWVLRERSVMLMLARRARP